MDLNKLLLCIALERILYNNKLNLIVTRYIRRHLVRRKRKLYFGLRLRTKHFKMQIDYNKWLTHYSEQQFYRLFRVQLATFHKLVEVLIRNDQFGLITKRFTGGNKPLPPEKSVLIFLRYLGSQETLNSISDRFNVVDSTVMHVVNATLYILLLLKKRFIFWPQNLEECEYISNGFTRYPGVLGAVDGSHVNIRVPHSQHDSYVDRYMNHSVNVMAISTADRILTYIFVGFPGSAHDARVFDNSCLVRNIERYGANKYFYDVDRYHLIGDAAFPLKSWLMKPYKTTNLNRMQRNHNAKLSSARVVIEHVFGIIKGRWARLQFINTVSIAKAIEIISACCVLHNFCQRENDDWTGETFEDEEHEDDIQQENLEGIQKRNRIAQQLLQ